MNEAYLVNALVTLHEQNWGVYRVRKLWQAARRAGRDQVARQVDRWVHWYNTTPEVA